MIEMFRQYLLVNRGLSENTVNSYTEALHSFARFAAAENPAVTWRTVEKQTIDDYVSMLVIDGYKPASIKQRVSALRTFYKTCLAMGAETPNPARYVSTPKLEEQLPKCIEVDAIHKALEDPCASATAKAVIAIIFETGVRLQELLDMRPSDIDNKTQSIKVRGKGMKHRTVYYGELTKKYGRGFRGWEHNQREIRREVWDALKPYSKSPQLSPHSIRHTFATVMLNNGMSMEGVRQLLGHEHMATTEIYAKLSNATVRAAYNQYAPKLN